MCVIGGRDQSTRCSASLSFHRRRQNPQIHVQETVAIRAGYAHQRTERGQFTELGQITDLIERGFHPTQRTYRHRFYPCVACVSSVRCVCWVLFGP